MSDETVEVTLEFSKDIAEKISYGPDKSLETSISMRIADCWYLSEKERQWEKQESEPTHQSVLDGQEPPYIFPSAHKDANDTSEVSSDE